jgi:hypothetical protein
MRAQKFGVESSVDAKKEARAARFGISAPLNIGTSAVSIASTAKTVFLIHLMGDNIHMRHKNYV